jgi:hypothetical protein
MSNADLILNSLETFATREGNPAPAIYKRLFAGHPEFEALFLMDTDGGVRGSMLQQAFDCLIDVAEGGNMARVILGSERVNHESYGVPDNLFDGFFVAIRDSAKASLEGNWTPEVDAAWSRLLAQTSELAAA